MIRLTAVIELEGQGRRALTHESSSKLVVIGRDASADFQIPLTTVSRQHARIAETDNVYVFEDLGSTHGSLINGKKLSKGEKKVLRDGDIIELTKARITCNIQVDKLVESDSGENTRMIADKAVAGILGRLGDGTGDGPYFRILNGSDEGEQLKFTDTGNEWNLGRSKDCEFVLNDANVSRKHAVVVKDWNGYMIQDLGSKNGVVVNDRKIGKPHRLKDADEITIGPIKLLYIDPNAELMAALADVPGFESEIPEEEPEELEDHPSVMGAPADGSGGEGAADVDVEYALGDGVDGDLDDPEAMAAAGPGAGAAGHDEYASIDPDLLKTEESRFPTEWVVVGAVGLLIVSCVMLLVFLYV
jgi:pSer/pThr/pTyr-binding forkhead associated (FHA) protein